jgi:uridine kinase
VTQAPESERIGDVATLAQSAIVAPLPLEDVGVLLQSLELSEGRPGEVFYVAARSGALGFVLEGEVECERRGAVRRLVRGGCFGEIDFARREGRERLRALTHARVAWLGRPAFEDLGVRRPDIAAHLLGSLAGHLAQALDALEPGASPSPAPLPLRRAAIGMETGEGREVFRRSAGLAFLEAARRAGERGLALGPSISSGRTVPLPSVEERARLLPILSRILGEVIAEDLPLAEELWDVERASRHFADRGEHGTVSLLATWGHPGVELLRCGETLALGPGPVLPRTGQLAGVELHGHPQGLLLDFGPSVRKALAPRPYSTVLLEARAPRYGAAMTRSYDDWLRRLGITSVGAFNRACITDGVKELIFVSEGFHEKHIAQIADSILSRSGLRVVTVAGPSASGKTTFIRRLTIQLAVNGLRTLGVSLDDYYRDHSLIPRDASGSQDFEVLDALDGEKLASDVRGLLSGARVQARRYDFKSGRSGDAGTELVLARDQVLLVEGIHALNPLLLPSEAAACTFRIFVHPAMSLPFDPLSRLEPSDVRLLRRIVRDRHQRGFGAAETLERWPSVRRGERLSIFPYQGNADCVFDTSLVYEPSVLRVFAERYLLEVPRGHAQHGAAQRLRRLLDCIVPIQPDNVPPTSILREFIGGSGFAY